MEREFLQKLPVDLRRGIADYILKNLLNGEATDQNIRFIGKIILAQSKFNKKESGMLRVGIRQIAKQFNGFLGENKC
ncbi:hypothetical protein KAR91_56080 [Candidatus Pacearchaeota archaeon]|nr:hypothetical protein [Candidatus Pacearchaeota archaeon]